MNEQEKKRIEDYINTYRAYPDEYKGIRDNKTLRVMDGRYRYDARRQTITRAEGHIDEAGNFVLDGVFTFPIDDPENKSIDGPIDFKQVVTHYNRLMMDLGYSGNTIGTEFSNDTDQWNLRDMVSEMEYIRSTFYDKGHPNNQMRTTDPKNWNRFLARIRGFLRSHRNQIDGLTVYKKHNSKYDD